MPVDTRISIPFVPQEGITGQILSAIQLANESHARQQQLGLEQQRITQQAPLVSAEAQRIQAQTGQIQAETAAGLPAAQAEAARARASLEGIQAKIAGENNPLVREQLSAQARQENANASLAEARLKLLQNPGSNPIDSVDSVIDPKKYPELNQRTKAQLKAVAPFTAFDPELPTKVLASGVGEIDTIERESDPRIIQARVQQIVQAQQYLSGAGKGALAGVAPKSAQAATADATKAGNDYAIFGGQMKSLRDQLASAQTGDQVAAAFAPVAATLGSNAFFGTHRFSPTELQTLDQLGSVPRQIDAWFSKHATGTLAPDTLKEFQGLVDRLEGAKQSAYTNQLKVINKNYGSSFEPLDFSGGTKSAAPTAGGAGTFTYNPTTGKLE